MKSLARKLDSLEEMMHDTKPVECIINESDYLFYGCPQKIYTIASPEEFHKFRMQHLMEGVGGSYQEEAIIDMFQEKYADSGDDVYVAFDEFKAMFKEYLKEVSQ